MILFFFKHVQFVQYFSAFVDNWAVAIQILKFLKKNLGPRYFSKQPWKCPKIHFTCQEQAKFMYLCQLVFAATAHIIMWEWKRNKIFCCRLILNDSRNWERKIKDETWQMGRTWNDFFVMHKKHEKFSPYLFIL